MDVPYQPKKTFEFCGNCGNEVLAETLRPAEQNGIDTFICNDCAYNCDSHIYAAPEPAIKADIYTMPEPPTNDKIFNTIE